MFKVREKKYYSPNDNSCEVKAFLSQVIELRCDNLCIREPLKLNAHNNNHLIKPFRWTDIRISHKQKYVMCISLVNRYRKLPYIQFM